MTAASPPGAKATAAVGFATMLADLLEVPDRVKSDDEVRAMLKAKLDQLPKAWHAKIGALLNSGREVYERFGVVDSTPEGYQVTPLDALALCDKRTRSRQYLERSLAMMCSEGLELDGRDTRAKGATANASVYERAWSRFGRELAGAETTDWIWFAQRAGRTNTLEKIYLRRGDGAWWSFGANLDRPQKSQIGTQTTALKRGRVNQSSGLASLADAQCAQRRALQRAMRSVRARLGIISVDHATAGGAR